MFDVDLFIQCVREKPALWEKSAPEYTNKYIQEKSWYEIAEFMYENGQPRGKGVEVSV